MSTAPCCTFPGEAFLSLVEERASLNVRTFERGLLQARSQKKQNGSGILIKKYGLIYGYRPRDKDLFHLSPYEFMRYWFVRAMDSTKMPKSNTQDIKKFDSDDVPMELRTSWILVRKEVPHVPKFHYCPMPKPGPASMARTARLLLTYFRPWTLIEKWKTDHVPYVSDIAKENSWVVTCTSWLDGNILTEEMRRVVTNFISATKSRPRDKDIMAENSDECVSDKECFVGKDDLQDVLITKPGGKQNEKCKDGHYANAISAIACAQRIWSNCSDNDLKPTPTVHSMKTSYLNAKEMCQAALRSAREGEGQKHHFQRIHEAKVHVQRYPSRNDVNLWMQRHCDGPWKTELAEEQYNIVSRVVARTLQEIDEDESPAKTRSEPLRWLTHGRPGVGKSKVIETIVKYFTEVLKWEKGLQFHVCTLQTALAVVLGAETCHRVAGVNPFRKFTISDSNLDAYMSSEPLQVRHLMSRFLLIDECFMNSAQFLAQMESNIRCAIPDTSPYKVSQHGVRSWGGLNILLFGDCYQLDCPEGTPLYHIPSKYLPSTVQKPELASCARGLDLVWDYTEHECIQGLTELTHCFRCADEWWNSVLDEIRILQLSADNHAFLHGLQTSVPGSWLHDRATCNNANCQALPDLWKKSAMRDWKTLRLQECLICQEERRSRRRVLPSDAQWHTLDDSLELTPAAVPNNDLRYEINKLRAQLFAKKHERQLLWCPAKDKVTTDALREDANLVHKKKEWLQRHDS